MSTFDSAIIQAFFTEDEIREAKTLSAQSALTQPAAGVYQLVVDGYKVQVDGLTFPGCTSCGCDDFHYPRLCAHVCFGVATIIAEHPDIEESIWPDTGAALNPEYLEHGSFYRLKMLPLTYSPSCQSGRTFAETVLDTARECRGAVEDDEIAKEVKRLFDDYFEQSPQWDLDIRDDEVTALVVLLRDLGVDDNEVRALLAKQPEYSRKEAWRWWLRVWRTLGLRPWSWPSWNRPRD